MRADEIEEKIAKLNEQKRKAYRQGRHHYGAELEGEIAHLTEQLKKMKSTQTKTFDMAGGKRLHIHVHGAGVGRTLSRGTRDAQYGVTAKGERVELGKTIKTEGGWKSYVLREINGKYVAVPIFIPSKDSKPSKDCTGVKDCGCGCKDAKPKKTKDAVGGRGGTYQTVAYKTYLIVNSVFRPDEFYIKKDGVSIGTAKSMEEAKKIIDSLV